jgi:hypothetical protein
LKIARLVGAGVGENAIHLYRVQQQDFKNEDNVDFSRQFCKSMKLRNLEYKKFIQAKPLKSDVSNFF